MKKMLPAIVLSLATSSAFALDPMPQETGFSGFFGAGAAGGSVESNFLAKALGVDLSNDKIYEYDSPNDTTIIIPSFQFELAYTFSSGNTRVRLANGAVDSSIDFSFNTLLGLRHDFDYLGNIELGALLPVPFVEVWEDPYLTGQDRNSTEQTSTGVQLAWDRMFGSGLELIASYRDIDLEDEFSGSSLDNLSALDRSLLDREGDVLRAELGYLFGIGDGDVKVRPHAAYIDRDLDGDAMSQDGYELGASLIYSGNGFKWLNRFAYQDLDGDAINPIFNQVNDSDVYLFASELRIPEPFGWEKWVTIVGVSWGENQADIDFNNSTTAMFAARLGRSF